MSVTAGPDGAYSIPETRVAGNSIGHGILAGTKTDRPQNPGRASKYKNKSCNVPKPEMHVSNQSSEDYVDT